jgi:glycosyltransferase involved in cell wall biosynthesis
MGVLIEKKPKVSIIVPVFNVENYLEQCLNSILFQSYRDYEVLMIDDGSIDKSESICKLYSKKDKRFKYFYQKNRGVSSARNFGLTLTLGDFIAFVDSDDVLHTNYLEALIKVQNLTQSEITCVNFLKVDYKQNIFDHSNKSKVKYKKFHFKRHFMINFLTAKYFQPQVWGKLFSKNLFDSNIRFTENVKHEEAFIMHLLFYKANSITQIINQKLYFYRSNRPNSYENRQKTRENYVDVVNGLNERVLFFKKLDNHLYLASKSYLLRTLMTFILISSKTKLYSDLHLIFYKKLKSKISESLLNPYLSPILKFKLIFILIFLPPNL